MFHPSRIIEAFWQRYVVQLPTWVHLRCAELELRDAPADHLSDALRAAREANLDRLARYRDARDYPVTPPGARGRTPCFRDGRGTLCAIAHLMHATGAADVAGELAAFENHSRIARMRSPALHGWIAESGFTIEELDRIQPCHGPSRVEARVGAAALLSIAQNLASLVRVRLARVW